MAQYAYARFSCIILKVTNKYFYFMYFRYSDILKVMDKKISFIFSLETRLQNFFHSLYVRNAVTQKMHYLFIVTCLQMEKILTFQKHSISELIIEYTYLYFFISCGCEPFGTSKLYREKGTIHQNVHLMSIYSIFLKISSYQIIKSLSSVLLDLAVYADFHTLF